MGLFEYFLKQVPDLPAPGHFYCRGCGTCCRTFVVNVTHFDVYRIIDQTAREPRTFLRLTEPDEDKDPESFQFIYERKNLALRHNYLRACVFLNEDNLCSIHEAKPGVCRTWPLDYNRKGDITWIKAHKDFILKSCAFTPEKQSDLSLQEEAIRIYNIERQLFAELIREWDQQYAHPAQTEEQFFLAATEAAFIDYMLCHRTEQELKRGQRIVEKNGY